MAEDIEIEPPEESIIETTQDEILQNAKAYEDILAKKQVAEYSGQEGLVRRGLLSMVQKSAKQGGYIDQVREIILHSSIFIEEWKNDGDLLALNQSLTDLTNLEIRAVLDSEISPGVTIQMYFISSLSNY